MSQFKNFATIKTQSYLNEFEWNEIEFYSYIITFEEHEGYFVINRIKKLEQALIGAQVQFNVSDDFGKITKYRILGFKETKSSKSDRLIELLKKRK